MSYQSHRFCWKSRDGGDLSTHRRSGAWGGCRNLRGCISCLWLLKQITANSGAWSHICFLSFWSGGHKPAVVYQGCAPSGGSGRTAISLLFLASGGCPHSLMNCPFLQLQSQQVPASSSASTIMYPFLTLLFPSYVTLDLPGESRLIFSSRDS